MIVWEPQQYSPMHNHPKGGCMVKVAQGPGIKETIYRKIPHVNGLSKAYFCCQHRNLKVLNNETIAPLEIRNSHGCDKNKFTTEVMQEVETFTAAIGNDKEVMTLKGDDLMHSVWNPYNESVYSLSHYLGDFTRIVFWLPDDIEHSTKCLSRGDDPRRDDTTNEYNVAILNNMKMIDNLVCDACST